MRKNIKHVLSFMVFTIMTLSLSIVVKAEDKFEIYDTTQDEIQAAIEQGSIEEEYLVGVIDLFNANVHTSSEDLNQLLLESLRQAIDMNSVTDKELQAAREKADLLVTASQEANEYNLNSRTNTVETTYLAGVALVANRGCTQTANYMLHAKQASPPTYYSRNDAWAKSCALNYALFQKIEPQFQNQILATGKSYGTVSGTYAYTTSNSTLDQYTALHNVNYSVTFSQKSNGYSAVYNITDVYDFDWSGYDNFAVGFGNNYCYAMQQLGLINPFKISIIYNS